MNLLLVDDDNEILNLYGLLFRQNEWNVIKTNDPDEALSRLHQGERFGMILIDFRMPRMNGIDLLKMIRHEDPEAKVVLKSALVSPELEYDAKREGAFRIIPGVFSRKQAQKLLDEASGS